MPRNLTRRKLVTITGAATATALLAGCTGDDNGEPADDGDDDGDADDGDADDADDGIEIEPGTTIELDGQTPGWVGVAPADIEGEENPTLILEEGGEYEIGWEEGDGSVHNIEIRDDGGAVVGDLETEEDTEGGPDQFLEFEASAEMTTYVCDPHETTMVGDIVVE